MPTSPSVTANGAQMVYRYTIGATSSEIPAFVLVSSDGTEVSTGTGVFVQGATPAGSNASGSIPIQVAGSDGTSVRTLRTDTTGNLVVGGNVANNVADSGNPIKIGGYANATIPTTVGAGTRVNGWFGVNGQTIIGCPSFTGADGQSNTVYQITGAGGSQGQLTTVGFVFNGTTWDRQRGDVNATVTRSALGSASLAYAGVTGGIVNNTAVAMFVAAGAGTRNFLHGLQWKNTSAVASEIVVLDGAAVIWRGHASASMTMTDGYTFDPPLRGTANTAMNVQMVTTGTATIVSAQGSTGA